MATFLFSLGIANVNEPLIGTAPDAITQCSWQLSPRTRQPAAIALSALLSILSVLIDDLAQAGAF